MQSKNINAWLIAGLLFVALIIVSFLYYSASKDLHKYQEEAKQNLSMQKDKIRADCSASDESSKAACVTDLQDLSDVLAQFSRTGVGTEPTATGTSVGPH